jgi:peptidoglycan-N-acetylglucosamine deacetylase
MTDSINTKIYLTFDDGPTPGVTPWVLCLLEEYQMKATFFCLGKQVEQFPELFRIIKEKGHDTGNHSFSHPNGWKTSFRSYIDDIKKADSFIQSSLFRPPYGKIGIRQWLFLRKIFKIKFWTCLIHDFNSAIPSDKLLKKLKKNSFQGAVIILHDSEKSYSQLKTILPLYLDYLKQNGIVSVSMR